MTLFLAPTRLDDHQTSFVQLTNSIIFFFSFTGDQEDVYACYSLMLSESESSSAAASKTAKRRPSSADSIGAGSTYESIDEATASSGKRAKLMELPAAGR